LSFVTVHCEFHSNSECVYGL